jgi:hypothetical protein
MRRSALIFLALSFVAYWLWSNDPPNELALGPVFPSIFHTYSDAEKTSFKIDPELHRWLVNEADKWDGSPRASTALVIELKRRALTFSVADLRILSLWVEDPALPLPERRLSVYLVSLCESAQSKESLKEIGLSPIPALIDLKAYSNEVNLRVQALDNLVKRLPSAESETYLKHFLSSTNDPALARHAQFWLDQLS